MKNISRPLVKSQKDRSSSDGEMQPTDDLRIRQLKPLLPPAILLEEYPQTPRSSNLVAQARNEAEAIVRGQDQRLLVVVGPCSINDPEAAREYAHRLIPLIRAHRNELHIVMRVYFEKPRTSVGWKGLINDPLIDGTFEINYGLRQARSLLLDLAELGVPAGTEFLDTLIPQFISDLISWGAIGARTTESQIHRELVSGLSMPVGFKNATSGEVGAAIDAISAARHPHHFLSVTKGGNAAIVATKGNPYAHIIHRGGAGLTNFHAEAIDHTAGQLEARGLAPRVMIDCSHGNSNKDHRLQSRALGSVAEQVAAGDQRILGIMLESHLNEGKQSFNPGDKGPIEYGRSITDACIGFGETVELLADLAGAVAAGRQT